MCVFVWIFIRTNWLWETKSKLTHVSILRHMPSTIVPFSMKFAMMISWHWNAFRITSPFLWGIHNWHVLLRKPSSWCWFETPWHSFNVILIVVLVSWIFIKAGTQRLRFAAHFPPKPGACDGFNDCTLGKVGTEARSFAFSGRFLSW